MFRTFNFQPPDSQSEAEARTRLIFVLVVAVVILFALYLRLQSSADTNERAIRLLVEALGQERFDWDRGGVAPRRPATGDRVARLQRGRERRRGDQGHAADGGGLPRRAGRGLRRLGGPDGCRWRARPGRSWPELPIRRGGGLALRVGYEVALKMNADIVVTLDADGQHLPEELGVMIAPIVAGEADYVNGSRLLGYFEKESTIRHLGVHFFSWLVTILTGTRVTDISSGYRAARADLLRPLVLEQDQFWTSEILIEALRHHARIVEVPITILAARRRQVEEAEVAEVRLELLEGHHPDLAALAGGERRRDRTGHARVVLEQREVRPEAPTAGDARRAPSAGTACAPCRARPHVRPAPPLRRPPSPPPSASIALARAPGCTAAWCWPRPRSLAARSIAAASAGVSTRCSSSTGASRARKNGNRSTP